MTATPSCEFCFLMTQTCSRLVAVSLEGLHPSIGSQTVSPLPGCGTSGKSLNLSELQCLTPQYGGKSAPRTPWLCWWLVKLRVLITQHSLWHPCAFSAWRIIAVTCQRVFTSSRARDKLSQGGVCFPAFSPASGAPQQNACVLWAPRVQTSLISLGCPLQSTPFTGLEADVGMITQ